MIDILGDEHRLADFEERMGLLDDPGAQFDPGALSFLRQRQTNPLQEQEIRLWQSITMIKRRSDQIEQF
jgi:hypothetical protein